MKITRRKLRVEVPTVAMGDIAFNLLVFFVILARSQDDSHLKWEPARTAEVENFGNPRVSITVDIENRVYLNGRQVSVREISTGVQSFLGDLPPGRRIVLLKIHKDTLAATFEPIVEAVSEAGGEVVHVLQQDQRK